MKPSDAHFDHDNSIAAITLAGRCEMSSTAPFGARGSDRHRCIRTWLLQRYPVALRPRLLDHLGTLARWWYVMPSSRSTWQKGAGRYRWSGEVGWRGRVLPQACAQTLEHFNAVQFSNRTSADPRSRRSRHLSGASGQGRVGSRILLSFSLAGIARLGRDASEGSATSSCGARSTDVNGWSASTMTRLLPRRAVKGHQL
jgi:hypothetical protein